MKNSRCFLQWETVVTNVDNDVDDSPENDLALNVDHVFEADECDAFDYDVDEGPTSQTMFMVSLTSEDPIYDEARPSYDSNNPFEVQDHDTFVDHMDEYHEVHEMQNDVQHNYVVDSDTDYTSDSNIIPYDCVFGRFDGATGVNDSLKQAAKPRSNTKKKLDPAARRENRREVEDRH
ncbi:hypothetical protein Tco_1108752 [Tanacetum coccineum]